MSDTTPTVFVVDDDMSARKLELRSTRDGYASLSRREKQVMSLVVSGLLNKQVGAELGISETTVKAHRRKVMLKMKAGSLADLVNMAARLPIPLGERTRLEALRARHDLLSLREREVMALVVRGLLNKQVGANLGISEITVKAHRGNVMRKMEADSLAQLVTMAAKLGCNGVASGLRHGAGAPLAAVSGRATTATRAPDAQRLLSRTCSSLSVYRVSGTASSLSRGIGSPLRSENP